MTNATSNGRKTVLMVLPQEGYDVEEFRSSTASLRSHSIDLKVASTSTGKAVGDAVLPRTIDYFFPTLSLDQVDPAQFDGVVFIGGDGAEKLWDQPKAHEIVKKILANGGIVGAIGTGVGVLAKADILRGVRATGDLSCKSVLEKSGAKLSSSQVEPRWLHRNPKRIVTAVDAGASVRFGHRVARDLGL